jgi:pimeloyl-ACP methyl ester carboxylesterase
MRRRRSFRDMVETIRAATLIVQGSGDRLVPLAASRELARMRPDWTLEVIEGIGHVPQLEDPERFVDVTERWLDGPVHAARRPGPG